MENASPNVDDIYLAALQHESGDARSSYLDEACAGNQELRRRVERLLEAQADIGSFLEDPAPEIGATVSHSVSETPGKVIGPYKLLEQIGEGGMGTVWMAQQTEPVKRLVALKLIKAGMDSKQVIARFEAERQALALMDHPNIAKVLDAGTVGQTFLSAGRQACLPHAGRPYFVMDLVKGVPITKYCDEHQLTPRQRLELFVPVCHAIQHAHQKGIIHRDLKPSNVLVALYDGKPVPQVIDFGVAKAAGQPLTEQTLVTGFGVIVGTLEYMSPEQAEINQLDIDTRSDIYSLGVLLYELLAGSPPFSRKELEKAGMLEMLRVIREQEPSKPSTKLSTAEGLPTLAANRGTEPAKLTKLVRGELDWIVMKALEKDRSRRYETANGFAMDVQRYLADEPVQACPPSARYRLRKFVRRNKGPVIAASVILISLLAGIIGTSAGMIWAVHERDDKARALSAETEAKEAAIKARAAEKEARDQALTALRAMTDEIVENQIARGTTLTEENREFLQKIIKHFEGFAAITADDADSRAIRAEGYARVGLMRKRLAELKETETAYASALAIHKQLAADFPTRPEFRRELARSYNNLGRLFSATGRLKEAETAHADALAIHKQLAAEFPDRPEYRQDLATSHNNLGILLSATGRLKEAEAAYADALAIRKQLAADFHNRQEYRQQLARSHNNLGNLHRATGRLKEAENAYANALAIQRQLAADFPNRPECREDLAIGYNNLGLLLRVTGRLKEAEAASAAALVLQKQLAAEFPARPEFRQKLATSHNNLGILFAATGRLKEAESAYANALAIRRKLAADFPTLPGFRQELGATYNSMGNLLCDAGRLKEAGAAYTDALTIQKQMAADFPNQAEVRNELAGTLVNLGNLCTQCRDFPRAKASVEEALPHHQAAMKANPRHPEYRQYFRNNLSVLVRANAGLLDQAGAMRTAEQLRDLGWHAPKDAYSAACALSLCIPIVQKNEQATNEDREKTVQFYGNQALQMLRDAVAKSFKDTEHLKQDRDLNPLREREDFKKLLAEVQAKQKELQGKNPQSKKQ